jgi:hypothetical protein
MSHALLRRTTPHQSGITGDGSANPIEWNDPYEIDNMQLTPNGDLRALESGIYIASWSLPYGNINDKNIVGAGWFHGGVQPRHEPFIYNGNPWTDSQHDGSIPGGGSDILVVKGSHIFRVDIANDPFIRLVVKIGGNTTKNVTLLYDAFFEVIKWK